LKITLDNAILELCELCNFFASPLIKLLSACQVDSSQRLVPFLAFYIAAPGCFIRTNCKLSMLLLIMDRIFILIRFFFGDAVAYVFLEMFLCFFQQFDRLAYVSRARFIGLFLDPLSILAPHDSNLTVYVC